METSRNTLLRPDEKEDWFRESDREEPNRSPVDVVHIQPLVSGGLIALGLVFLVDWFAGLLWLCFSWNEPE